MFVVMNFTTQKIGDTAGKKRRSSVSKRSKFSPLKRWGVLLVALIVSFLLIFGGLYALFSNIGLKGLVFSFGESLEQDYNNRTNFLLLGTGVLGQNEGSDLTDTIMLGSFDHNAKNVTMLSIPRDFYVKHETLGGQRINQIYDSAVNRYEDNQKAIDVLRQEVERITGVEIHYYAKVNFEGFKDIVDAVGGIEVDVKESIYDSKYPKDGTLFYETFSIQKGVQTLDGDTALKYARSRKTTSDFDRARRQQEILFAIKTKAMQREILTSPSKIKDLYYSVSDNLETDLSIREIIEMANLGQDINREKIASYVLNDDPTQCGGFLYPPERALYGGAAVLRPISESYDYIHGFVDLILSKQEKSGSKIQVLNGTKTPGLAGEVKMKLQRYCFDVIRFGNARNQKIDETILYFKGMKDEEGNVERPEDLDIIKGIVPGADSSDIPEKYFESQYVSDADVIIELGQDYVDGENMDSFVRYIYTPPVKSSTSVETTETADSSAE